LLWARIWSGIIGGPLFLGLTWAGGLPLTGAVAVLSYLGFLEYASLASKANVKVDKILGAVMGLVFIGAAHLGSANFGIVAAGAMVVGLVSHLFRFPAYNVLDSLATFSGSFYVFGLLSYLILIRKIDPGGRMLGMFIIGIVWAFDVTAYFTGGWLGRYRLCPSLSPGKTLEGFLGGLVAAGLVGLGFGSRMQVGPLGGALTALATAAAAQAGDLVESCLKRTAGAKDSGSLIPGHGGILDRFDGFLLAVPVFYYIVTMLF